MDKLERDVKVLSIFSILILIICIFSLFVVVLKMSICFKQINKNISELTTQLYNLELVNEE